MTIKEMFKPRCKHRHTERTHPHCFENGKVIEYVSPKPTNVLVFDVETLPLVVYTFQTWNTNIYSRQVIKDWCILSYSAKWINDDKIISDVLTPKEALVRDDRRLLKDFWKLLERADVVVTHNGKSFDIKKLNTRFWKHDLNKPSSYKVIDTLTTAKAVFGLTYNSMDFIAKFKEAQEKMETEFALWAACDVGDRQALADMVMYNEQDVIVQEQIYMSMRQWIPNHPDLGIYENLVGVCPTCLSKNHQVIGLFVASTRKYPEHRCSDCGCIWHESKEVKE